MKKKAIKAKKIIKQLTTPEPTPLPERKKFTYTANMDNIIFEAVFAEGSDKDKDGKHVPAHLREVETYTIISIGELVNNKNLKKGVKIVPENIGKITVLQMDEKGYIGTIKPHHIIAVIK